MTDVIAKDALDEVFEHIREEEIVELALALGNLDSPTGQEGAASDHVYAWLDEHGFAPERVALFPDRANVAARVAGTGGGPSLLLNSHLDTTIAKEETLTTLNAGAPVHHSAWREGDRLVGNGIVNNKGVMATWMIACKALKEAGIRLRGDLLMTMVVGEIGLEPVDEFQPPEYVAKEAGAQFVVNRGYTADYGLVAEGTDFKLCWVEAGKAFFKVTVHGIDPPLYTPYLERPTTMTESRNAIVRAAKVIEAIEDWAYEYQTRHTYVCDGGTVVPKVSVNAIRSGTPYKITKTPSVCQLYVDARITPEQRPGDVQRELQRAVDASGVPASIVPFVYRRGYEAQNVAPLVEKIERVHARHFGERPGQPIEAITSMWRDSNVFNAAAIPTVIYGPGASVGGGNFSMEIQAMTDAARVYAAIVMEVCGIAEPRDERVSSTGPGTAAFRVEPPTIAEGDDHVRGPDVFSTMVPMGSPPCALSGGRRDRSAIGPKADRTSYVSCRDIAGRSGRLA
jgi:acetylornithine deacetylase/succinyl-diaminopimelate desuccinylase-like protein